VGKRNFDAVDRTIAAHYVLHHSSLPEPVHGPWGYREIAEMGASVADATMEIDQVFATDDRASRDGRQRGTHA